jgi:hypothetical protein
MRFAFSSDERSFIFDSDLCLTEVGLKLADRSPDKDGNYVVLCSEIEGAEFLKSVREELSYRGFRPEETRLRALAERLGVRNVL